MAKTAVARKPKRTSIIPITFWVLGILAGTLSLTSLILNWSEIGVSGLAARVIEEYRAVTNAAKELLFDWWTIRIFAGFTLPDWVMDIISIWLLAAFGILRHTDIYISTMERVLSRPMSNGKEVTPVRLPRFPIHTHIRTFAFAPYLYLKYLASDVRSFIARLNHKEKPPPGYRFVGKPPGLPPYIFWMSLAMMGGMLGPFIGTALFFLWNAIQL